MMNKKKGKDVLAKREKEKDGSVVRTDCTWRRRAHCLVNVR